MSKDYGRLGGGGRRSSSAVWQWVIIGLVFGFGCAVIAFFGLLLTGLIGIDPTASGRIGATQTPVVMVITATDDPTIPTQTPIVVTVIAEPTTAPVSEGQITIPTATTFVEQEPTTETITEEPTPDPTTETPTGGEIGDPNANTQRDNNVAVVIPPQLETIISPLTFVEGGTFLMGTRPDEISEAVRLCVAEGGACQAESGDDSVPQHEVQLDDYQIEITEVTLSQYVAFLNYLRSENKTHANGCGSGGLAQACVLTHDDDPNLANIYFDSNLYEVRPEFLSDYPVVNVTWYGADAYCRTIGRRLPTEAEWEHAARGVSNFLYPWGNTWDPTLANTNRRPATEPAGPAPVTNYPGGISQFGAYNMSGNVREWVADWYNARQYQTNFSEGVSVNPQGPERATEKVVRGGSWADNPFFSRLVQRLHLQPASQNVTIGFRCAADIAEPATSLGALPNTGGSTTPLVEPGASPDPANLGVIGGGGDDGGAPTLPPAPAADATELPIVPPGG